MNKCIDQQFAKGRQKDRIPPTETALKEHIKRAVYLVGYCWGQTFVVHQQLPSPGEWGWEKRPDDNWVPFLTSLPEARQDKTRQDKTRFILSRQDI